MTAKVAHLFPTPVIVDELEGADALNAELETVILDQRRQDAGLQLSNRGGWQSKRNFPQWAGDPGRRVVEHAMALATANTGHRLGPEALNWSVDVWANVSASGGFNMPHIHGGTIGRQSITSALAKVRAVSWSSTIRACPPCGCTRRVCGSLMPDRTSARKLSRRAV